MTGIKTTAPMRVTTALEPSYPDLLARVRQLFHTDVETRFEMAVIFGKMLRLKTADEVAEDTDMTPGGVARIARVAEFWGSVRIKSEGRKTAPWYLYDRVAHDVMIDDKRRTLIKRAAPRGLATVRQMVRDARQVSIAQVNEVVNGKRATKTTTTRSSSGTASRSVGSDRPTPHAHDAETYLTAVLHSLDAGNEYLDKLESLSEADAAKVRARINAAAQHLVRLSKVEP